MKKKTLSLVCALVLAASLLLPLVASAMTWTAYVYTANGKSLNMRKAPVTHADNKIAGIPYGASVTILDYVNNRTWAYVNYNGKDGYVMSRYLTFDKPGPRPNPNPKPNPTPSGGDSSEISFAGFQKTGYTVLVRPSAPGGYVNLRWAPSKKLAVYERVYDGQELEVIAQNSTWAQVRNPSTDSVGFIMRGFLTTLAGDHLIGTGASVN